MIVRSRSPLRISFGGGGTDVSPYCDERGGAVLSATIQRYAYVTLQPCDEIKIHSVEYNISVSYGVDAAPPTGPLDLATAVVNHFRNIGALTKGVEIFLHNDAPPRSGLGSSSAIVVAMINAFNRYLGIPMDAYGVADLAYHIERKDAGQPGGRQDQYASSFGGFNFMEFRAQDVVVCPLRLPEHLVNELQYRLVCAYVGSPRTSSEIIENQIENYRTNNGDAVAAMDELKELSYGMRDRLLCHDIDTFSELLHSAWLAKRRMASGIATEDIDRVYAIARGAGAVGGKLSGAGGGGFMYFLCQPNHRLAVQKALRDAQWQLIDMTFSREGAESWRVR